MTIRNYFKNDSNSQPKFASSSLERKQANTLIEKCTPISPKGIKIIYRGIELKSETFISTLHKTVNVLCTKDKSNLIEACRQVGINHFTYYKICKRLGKPKKQHNPVEDLCATDGLNVRKDGKTIDRRYTYSGKKSREIYNSMVLFHIRDKLTVKQACRKLGIHAWTYYRICKRFNMPSIFSQTQASEH